MTQTDVARQMDMVTSTVSAIEAGKRAVTGTELYSLAQIYGRPVAHFLERGTPEVAPGFQYLFRAVAEKLFERRPLVKLEQLADDYDLLENAVIAIASHRGLTAALDDRRAPGV
jgi:transcriptional regulator with XRE-family HTH domain